MSTYNASQARKRTVAVLKNGYVVGVYPSVKRCGEVTGVPDSRICEYARAGIAYKGMVFKYLNPREK